MPTYAFKCQCGYTEDRNVPVADRDTTIKCPNCEQDMTRAVTATKAVVFKGGGFYATDYKGKK